MTFEKHIGELQRLELERSRDMIFEAKTILAELQRDHSISAQDQRSLEQAIGDAERRPSPEPALQLRDFARTFYAPPATSL
jgi:hypothetical protein